MQTPAGPKGTRDFYPDDTAVREAIFSSWRATCRRYGFEEFDAPMFEHLELYTQKSGDEIEKQLYVFQDKAGRQLALRPELTPSLARMVAVKGNNLKRPVRWFSIPRLFRYEKMQKGRLREFFQLNMDILGIAETAADAELIAASIDMMRDLGFTSSDFGVHVSSRSLLEQLFLALGVPAQKLPALYAVLDRRHKVSNEEFEADLSAAVSPEASAPAVAEALSVASISDLAKLCGPIPAATQLDELFSHMAGYGMSEYVSFDIGIVRGLAYYTGIVFELFDAKRSLRAIAGGGRYDNLVKLYGGPDTPATGFAAGDVVLGEMLNEKKISVQNRRSDVFLISFDDKHPGNAIKTATAIRNAGISCEFALRKVNAGKQMELANAARALLTVFVGGEEEKEGKVKMRNMKTGAEKLVVRSNLIDEINKSLTSEK
jgi:histidyl-tRNA synthetase